MKATKKAKLLMTRFVAIVAILFVVEYKSIRHEEAKKWRNLLHYLIGSGKNISVKPELFEKAHRVIRNAIKNYHRNYCGNGKPSISGRYFVSHSTMYDGHGFNNRPELFYVVGCFAFNVEGGTKGYRIYGNDVYDWHPADQEGHYFGSPLGESKLASLLIKVGAKLVGQEYFQEHSWPTGAANSISNQLWADMALVGAKPFATTFDFVVKEGFLYEDLVFLEKEKNKIFLERFVYSNFYKDYQKRIYRILIDRNIVNKHQVKKKLDALISRRKEIYVLYKQGKYSEELALIDKSLR